MFEELIQNFYGFRYEFICFVAQSRFTMADYPTPPRRAPRKKLKMPLFGGMLGGGTGQGGTKNFSTYLFILVGLGMLGQAILPQLWAEKVYDSESELREMEIDGAIRKKYFDASDRAEIHYILVVKEKGGKRKKIDLYQADSTFFEQVAVPQRLKKESGSLKVRVTRFSKPDTTLEIRFKK